MTDLSAFERSALSREARYQGRNYSPRAPEVRDPRGATSKAQYTAPGSGMVSEWNADEAIRWAYYSNVVVFGCVRAYVNSILACRFRVGPDPEKPKTYRESHPLLTLLGTARGTAAPAVSSRMWWGYTIANWIVSGKAASEKERDGSDRLRYLWPLPVTDDLFRPIPSDSGSGYFTGYQYGRLNARKTYTPEQMAYFWRPSLRDFRQPESLLQAARLDISVAVMSDRYANAFLRNDARPASIVVHEMFDDPAEMEAWRRQFIAKYQGPDNAGQVAFTEVDSRGDGQPVGQKLDVKVLGLSQKDAQFTQQYEQKLTNIAIGLGVPFSLLDASGRTFDNANVEMRTFYENRALPMGQDIVDWINMDIAPEFGTDICWLDYSHIPALRPPSRWGQIDPQMLVARKLLKPSMFSSEMGIESDESMDTMPGVGLTLVEQAQAVKELIDAGFDPADALKTAGLPAMQLAPDAPTAPTAGQPPSEQGDEPPAVVPLPTAASAETIAELRAEADDIEERRARIWRTKDAQVRGLEATWTRAFRALFAKQARATLDRLRGKPGRQMLRAWVESRDDATVKPLPDDIFTPGYWLDETVALADPLLRSVFGAGASRLVDDVGISFDIQAPYVDEFIQARANQLAGEVTDTTYGAIKDALSAGVDAGESIDALAQRVQAVFDEADAGRALTIARTEVNSAYHAAGQEVADQLGADIVAGKEWIAVRDGRTRPDHAEADGQVVDVSAMFRVGGVEMRTPGTSGEPSEDIQCRCAVGWLTPDEMAKHRSTDVIELREAEARLRAIAEAAA